MMDKEIEQLRAEIQNYLVDGQESLERYRLKFISRKGRLAELLGGLKDAPPEKKREIGAALNLLKNQAQDKFKELVQQINQQKSLKGKSVQDFTLPPIPDPKGSIHPLTIIRGQIVQIFERIGFNLSEGPEIEDDWHNFSALNFPPNHPAREMQDTFFIERNPDIALRTHTSSVQIRVMESEKPPIRTLSLGRVFRNEAISARAHCIFHQIEGLYVDKNVSFVDLKQTLLHFAREMFASDTRVRFRPSYFPFTEPSAEFDISCQICHGDGCNICKYTGWVEIAGSGMVDPDVLANCKINPDQYTGFAFGMGLERIAMLKYEIKDLRLFTENDIRFLKQFSDFI